ncbi:hypothetical protein ACQCT5_10370 [Sutcliffiella halmapala]
MPAVSTIMKKFKKQELAERLIAAEARLSELERYDKPLVFASDGTVLGSQVYVEGKALENLTTLRIKLYHLHIVEVSYEQMDGRKTGISRNWLYGEDPELTEFYKENLEKRRKERWAQRV